jgi:hypothetical protein
MRDFSLARASASGRRTMARRMISAAAPWSGALMAWRSPKLRSCTFFDLMPAIQMRRPKMVFT